MTTANRSAIVGGNGNTMTNVDRSSIVGGDGNAITNADRSSIVGGDGNIVSGMDDVVMLGCVSRTATAAQTVHLEKLVIMDIPVGDSTITPDPLIALGLDVGTVYRDGNNLMIVT